MSGRNGALALMESLHASGVTFCFANPGTSELHLVQALERVPGITGVLCPTESVAVGAADGFGRMRGVPAATLLHQGPGLANGLAHMHNARRAQSPVVNVVGTKATIQDGIDLPLDTDIVGLARPMSRWVRVCRDAESAAADGHAAVVAARRPPGGVATLVVPVDVAWTETGVGVETDSPAPAPPVPEATVDEVARILMSGTGVTLLLGGPAVDIRALMAADRIAQATGTRVLTEPFPGRLRRGAGAPAVEPLDVDPTAARALLAGSRHLVLAGAAEPATAFAYPGVPARLAPSGCAIIRLGDAEDDLMAALTDLADLLAPCTRPRLTAAYLPRRDPAAPLTAAVAIETVAALLPEGAVLVDESNASGTALLPATVGAAPHDLLTVGGFAIGHGPPLATGAAVACSGRPVVCLESDGSALYTLGALWTQARENLDITTVLFNNCGYETLRRESLHMLGDGLASSLFELTGPDLDVTALATGLGVPAARADTVGELAGRFRQALTEHGPHLVEVRLSSPG